jgi:hypothetical protein
MRVWFYSEYNPENVVWASRRYVFPNLRRVMEASDRLGAFREHLVSCLKEKRWFESSKFAEAFLLIDFGYEIGILNFALKEELSLMIWKVQVTAGLI